MTGPLPESPPITVQHIRLLRASFDLNESYAPAPGLAVSFGFSVQRTFPTPRDLVVVLTAVLFDKAESPPFHLSVEYEARFSVTDDAGAEVLRKFARYNAPGMILPYIRELITTVSARSGVGALVMPPISIQKLVDQIEQGRESDNPEIATSSGTARYL